MLRPLLLVLLLNSAWAIDYIPHKKDSVIDISSPASIKECDGYVWAYSVGERSIYKIKDNLIIKQLSLEKFKGEVTAIGCDNLKRLIIATEFRNKKGQKKQFLYDFKTARPFKTPGQGVITDIDCDGSRCLVLQGDLYKTNSFSSYDNISFKSSRYIETEKHPNNPYRNRILDDVLPAGSYFRVKSLSNGGIVLLDPIRSSIIISMNGKVKKWGKWGVWEGRIVYPKDIAIIDNRYIAVSDVALKHIFIFDLEGNYIGAVRDEETSHFGYPIKMDVVGNKLYVADLLKNQISIFKFGNISNTKKAEVNNLSDLVRKNIFRDPGVHENYSLIRCLNCHDGQKINSLRIFVKSKHNHPIKLNEVSCHNCHNAHHTVSKGHGDAKKIEEKSERMPHMLKAPFSDLCNQCHKDKFNIQDNHINLHMKDKNIAVTKCSDCHTTHFANPKLLKLSPQALCVKCHGKEQRPKGHPYNKYINCYSCHSIHKTKHKFSYAKKSSCLNCHKMKFKKIMGTNKHLMKMKKSLSGKKAAWPDGDSLCLNCHSPHNKKIDRTKNVCLKCHKDKKFSHRSLNSFAIKTSIPKGVKVHRNRFDCFTCHDAHENDGDRKLLRPYQKVEKLCLGCHDKSFHGRDFSVLFKNFHKEIKLIKGAQ